MLFKFLAKSYNRDKLIITIKTLLLKKILISTGKITIITLATSGIIAIAVPGPWEIVIHSIANYLKIELIQTENILVQIVCVAALLVVIILASKFKPATTIELYKSEIKKLDEEFEIIKGKISKYFSCISWSLLEDSIKEYLSRGLMISDAFDHMDILVRKYNSNEFNYTLPHIIDNEIKKVVNTSILLSSKFNLFELTANDKYLREKNFHEIQNHTEYDKEIDTFKVNISILKEQILSLYESLHFFFSEDISDSIKSVGDNNYIEVLKEVEDE